MTNIGCLKWSCRLLRGMKLGKDVLQGLVLVDLALLSLHAGAAVSKVGRKGAALSRKDCERSLSCTTARVLQFSIRGSTRYKKVFLQLLRPRTDAALSGMRGLSCTEPCAVAPKKGHYVMWLSAFRQTATLHNGLQLLKRTKAARKQIATLHNSFSLVRQHRAQCSSVPSFPRVLHPSAALVILGTPFHV